MSRKVNGTSVGMTFTVYYRTVVFCYTRWANKERGVGMSLWDQVDWLYGVIGEAYGSLAPKIDNRPHHEKIASAIEDGWDLTGKAQDHTEKARESGKAEHHMDAFHAHSGARQAWERVQHLVGQKKKHEPGDIETVEHAGKRARFHAGLEVEHQHKVPEELDYLNKNGPTSTMRNYGIRHVSESIIPLEDLHGRAKQASETSREKENSALGAVNMKHPLAHSRAMDAAKSAKVAAELWGRVAVHPDASGLLKHRAWHQSNHHSRMADILTQGQKLRYEHYRDTRYVGYITEGVVGTNRPQGKRNLGDLVDRISAKAKELSGITKRKSYRSASYEEKVGHHEDAMAAHEEAARTAGIKANRHWDSGADYAHDANFAGSVKVRKKDPVVAQEELESIVTGLADILEGYYGIQKRKNIDTTPERAEALSAQAYRYKKEYEAARKKAYKGNKPEDHFAASIVGGKAKMLARQADEHLSALRSKDLKGEWKPHKYDKHIKAHGQDSFAIKPEMIEDHLNWAKKLNRPSPYVKVAKP